MVTPFRYTYSTSKWINRNRHENNHTIHYRVSDSCHIHNNNNANTCVSPMLLCLLLNVRRDYVRSGCDICGAIEVKTTQTLKRHSRIDWWFIQPSMWRPPVVDVVITFLSHFPFFVLLYLFIYRVSADCTHQKGDSQKAATKCRSQCAVAGNCNYIHK